MSVVRCIFDSVDKQKQNIQHLLFLGFWHDVAPCRKIRINTEISTETRTLEQHLRGYVRVLCGGGSLAGVWIYFVFVGWMCMCYTFTGDNHSWAHTKPGNIDRMYTGSSHADRLTSTQKTCILFCVTGWCCCVVCCIKYFL